MSDLKLCPDCDRVVLDAELDNCKGDRCFDCCEEHHLAEGLTCNKTTCSYKGKCNAEKQR